MEAALVDYAWHLDALRQRGYRLTPQRVMVIAALGNAGGHLSADDLYGEVCQQYPYIDLATVYRSLQLLTKLHLVSEIRVGATTRYELVHPAERHHHMVCEECAAAFDLPPRYLDDLREHLLRDVGFEPHMEHFTVSGLCEACRLARDSDASTRNRDEFV